MTTALQHPRPGTAARRLPLLTVAATTAVLGVCLAAGLAAALLGGGAERFGDGPGGLAGVPQLALLAVAALLGLPSAVALRRRPAAAVLVLGGSLLVALGYFFFSHAVDPCSLGVWDAGTTVGGAPVCETGPWGTSMSRRFHLLEHALSTGLLLAGWLAALRAAGVVRAPAARADL